MNDIGNMIFESLGGFVVLLSVRKLYRDKQVKGMSVTMMLFFTAWGYWNLYFYPSVGAWLSFYGSVGVTFANTIYTIMVCWYLKQEDTCSFGK